MIFNPDEKINQLSLINPDVNEYISSMGYVGKISIDSINYEFIIQQCYEIIINTLDDIGIQIIDNDILSNGYDSSSLEWLAHMFNDNEFLNLLSIYPFIINWIEIDIDDINNDELLLSFLNLLKTKFFDIEEYQDNYVILHDKITSNYDFRKYLKDKVFTHKTMSLEISSIDKIESTQLQDFFAFFKEAINSVLFMQKNILNKNSELISYNMESYFKKFFLQDIISDTPLLSLFSLYFSRKKNDILNEALIKSYTDAYTDHLSTSLTHALYYKINNIQLSKKNLLMIIIGSIIEEPISLLPLNKTIEKNAQILLTMNESYSIQFSDLYNQLTGVKHD